MLPFFRIVCSVILLLLLFFFFILLQLWKKHLRQIGDLRRQQEEIGKFFDLFLQSLRRTGTTTETMDSAARYIREMLMAKAVCIYRVDGEYFRAVGSCGAYRISKATAHLESRSPEDFRAALRSDVRRVGEGFLGKVAQNHCSEVILDAKHDPRLADIPAAFCPAMAMAVPVLRGEETVGLICATGHPPMRRFRAERLAQLQFTATQVRLVQELGDSFNLRQEQQRLNQELEFARQLQSSLLPKAVPEWGEFAISAQTSSAKEVNGDFYDFVEIDENRLLVVQGDACGKGIPACLLASMTHSFIRAAAEHFTTVEALLREVNRNLVRDTDAERFVTLCCCLLDRKNHTFEYGRAGHTELICYTRQHTRIVKPDGPGLGILPDEYADFDTFCFCALPGLALILYSDGYTEALNAEGEEFGVNRLADALLECGNARKTPDECVTAIIDKVHAFEPEQHDDRTLILIQVRENPAGQS